jgi:hypothetical protein
VAPGRPKVRTSSPQKRGAVAKAALLAAFAQTGNVAASCRAAGVSRRTHYDWLAADAAYAEAFADAQDDAADALESEAWRRGTEGVTEPLMYQGAEVGTVQRYSDTLLIFLLKGLRPEKYRERFDHRAEVTVRDDPQADAEIARVVAERQLVAEA